MKTQETGGAAAAAGQARARETNPIVRWAKEGVAVGAVCCLSAAAAAGLQMYITAAQRDDIVPRATTSLLDDRARQEAQELRRKELPVIDTPYLSVGEESLVPFSDEAHQRKVDARFRDEETGLVIQAQTHLCLPGVDPCISGGMVSVADETARWQITFQLLGAPRPAAFQSSVPRSRQLLEQLRSRVNPSSRPTQEQYRSALQEVLDAEPDSGAQQASLQRLLDLLLTSFFASDEFAQTAEFAEGQGLFD